MRAVVVCLLCALSSPFAQGLGFANGIKIGEVTDTSAVIWVRLTERAEADRQIDEWDGGESDATFKLFVSATPVVGPDRRNKNDNHANEGFAHEGRRLRKFLSAIPGCFVINGDRHWQYHSVDVETGLHEFGSGPASDKHAGGWKKENQPEWQKFLRIKGGFLSMRVEGRKATVRHHDVDGVAVNEVAMER